MADITRRSLLRTSGLALAAAGSGVATPARPNILFISTDQHTASVLGANGHPIVKTPNLDRLAAAGVNFRNAYSGNPVCAPGRASMMTGLFASDVGSYCNSTPFDGRVPTWGNRLRDAGYACWATGKMDLWHDKDLGFQEVGTTHGHSEGPDITSLFRNPVCFRPDERDNVNGSFRERESPDLSKAENAIKFLQGLKAGAGKPWCAYVGFSKPHPKFIANAEYQKRYPAAQMPLAKIPDGYLEQRHQAFQILANFKNIQVLIPEARMHRARAAYYGLVSEADELIGNILNELDRTGQRENTLIVYTSDHGEMLGEHGLWLKNTLLDGASRIPLIMAGPGLPKGKVIDTPVAHVDMVATLLNLGGASARGIRGHSLAPMANGQASDHPGFAFSESHSEGNCTGSFMIRKGDWKYLYFTGGDPLLFNMKNEMGEYHDLAGDKRFADVQKELHAHLTSLVEPDRVTLDAFRRQDQILRDRVKSMSRDDFHDDLVGRLGSIQARTITDHHYGGPKA